MDVVRQIQDFNAGREPERLRFKYLAMRADPFAFLRATCHLFYARLPRGGVFKSAPKVWVCGDLHLENFGSYKGDNRLVYFDVNDFDEAALAPASWDLVRLLASLFVGADSLRIDAAQARALGRTFIDAYGQALALGKAYWIERDTASGLVRALLDDLRERRRVEFLDTRSTLVRGRRVLRVDDRKALAVSQAQRERVVEFMRGFAKAQPDPAFYDVIDVVRRAAGTGSLGVERYALLVRGKGSPDRNYLLDLKQALPTALAPALKLAKIAQPAWPSPAHRIVALQQREQAVSMAFLQPVSLHGTPCVLRALQPAEDRVSLKRSGRGVAELEQVIATLGRLTAWAQLRACGRDGSASADELMAYGPRRKWKQALIDAAHVAAAQVRKDAATFAAAWDDGVFAEACELDSPPPRGQTAKSRR